jgi:hypothetical protein
MADDDTRRSGEVCAACGLPTEGQPTEHVSRPGTDTMLAYHVACMPPVLEEQI